MLYAPLPDSICRARIVVEDLRYDRCCSIIEFTTKRGQFMDISLAPISSMAKLNY